MKEKDYGECPDFGHSRNCASIWEDEDVGVSVHRCRELLGISEDLFSDDEVHVLRSFLYGLADLICCDIEACCVRGEGGDTCSEE